MGRWRFDSEKLIRKSRFTEEQMVAIRREADRTSVVSRRGDRIKALCFDYQGLLLLAKRLECGRFVLPQVSDGRAVRTATQLSMLLEGIDRRMPVRTHARQLAA